MSIDPRKIEDKNFLATYAKRGDLMLVRGEGSYVFDDRGKKYLDFTTSLGIASLGHAHPRIISVLQEQASEIIACNTSFYSPVRAELCEKLAGYFSCAAEGVVGERVECEVSLLNSGTEATEAALKFAKGITGKSGIVYTKNAFHGRTMGALSACGTMKYQKPAHPLVPDFHMVPYSDVEAMESVFAERGNELAAVILEPIQGESGVIEASQEYFQKVRELCDQNEVVLIFDEVQTGSGRTGEFFCFEHFDVVPDMVCLAKALGTGFPISATIVKKELAEKIPPKFHGSTYGAGPLASRVGLEVLNIFEEEELLNNVTEMGAYFKGELEKLAGECGKIREVRGRGLILAIELKERVVGYLKKLQEEEGLLVLACGPLTMRFLPPFNVSKEEIDESIVKVRKVLIDT